MSHRTELVTAFDATLNEVLTYIKTANPTGVVSHDLSRETKTQAQIHDGVSPRYSNNPNYISLTLSTDHAGAIKEGRAEIGRTSRVPFRRRQKSSRIIIDGFKRDRLEAATTSQRPKAHSYIRRATRELNRFQKEFGKVKRRLPNAPTTLQN